MLRSILTVGLLAGLVAGIGTAAIQHVTTVPLILAAEVYENAAAEPHEHAAADRATGTEASGQAVASAEHEHGDEAWSPSDGLERTVSTSAATVVSGVGLSLVLVALMLLAGERITPITALTWAAGGFVATGLATGLGLAPELPGSTAAPLEARQLWWIVTAIATAAGLYAVFRLRTPIAIAVGLVLIVAPHVVGAPHVREYGSTAPAELAAHFASTSLAVHAVFWALVGLCVGVIWPRVAPA